MTGRRRGAPRGSGGARFSAPRLAGIAVVALTVAVPLAGCAGGDAPVSPLPVQAPASRSPGPAPPSPSALPPSASPPSPGTPGRPPGTSAVVPPARRPSPAAPPTTAAGRTPTATRSPGGLPGTCFGAVRHDLVLAETELALVRSLCFATGGVLRIIGIGPGEVGVDREDLVSRSYEAGVVDIRFVRPGTVDVLIPQGGTTHTVTVVVR
ncbi:hypothetical protein OG989_17905 [Micromonospora sp. NBC_01740]|uniref:hypothetical protein n=1 Tax=Micromonospora sp. NBC_01740 TaxID=2975986 RepID=UPI002E0D993B|nr:hypothetical protein OG989_17905 [Micromonospora sp. NBC_01740]